MIENGIVQFSADFCWPCRIFEPVLKKLSTQYEIEFKKIDVEEEEDIAEKFNIISVPRTIIYKEWEVVEDFVWAIPEDDVILILNKYF